jgi:hypothetical protein
MDPSDPAILSEGGWATIPDLRRRFRFFLPAPPSLSSAAAAQSSVDVVVLSCCCLGRAAMIIFGDSDDDDDDRTKNGDDDNATYAASLVQRLYVKDSTVMRPRRETTCRTMAFLSASLLFVFGCRRFLPKTTRERVALVSRQAGGGGGANEEKVLRFFKSFAGVSAVSFC